MLVRFTSGQDVNPDSSVYLDADLVRLVVKNPSINSGTVLYQQDSDTPISVLEDIETVVSTLLRAGVKCLDR